MPDEIPVYSELVEGEKIRIGKGVLNNDGEEVSITVELEDNDYNRKLLAALNRGTLDHISVEPDRHFNVFDKHE